MPNGGNNTIQKALEESAALVRHYLDKILDAPMTAIGGMLGDKIDYWRFKNKINTILKAKKFLEEKGISPVKILPDIFVPLIEDSANVEKGELQDMFASLLTCHLDPATQMKVHPSYSKLLAQFSPLDAKIIDHLRNKEILKVRDSDTIDRLSSVLGIPGPFIYLSFQNLCRLGICEMKSRNNRAGTERVSLTPYGRAFMHACSRLMNK